MLEPATVSVLPAWITPAVIADTRAVWEPLYGRPLAESEIIEIHLNTAGLLRVLFGLRQPHSTIPVADSSSQEVLRSARRGNGGKTVPRGGLLDSQAR